MRSSGRLLQKMPIGDFVRQGFADGVPYDEAKAYTAVEVATIIPMLQDKASAPYWANVATVIGIVAPPNSYQTLRSLVFSTGSGSIPVEEYNGRSAAIMSMGYIVLANGNQQARKFLEDHIIPASWASVGWRAPYQLTDAERNADLASVAALGLSLAGDPPAVSYLQRMQKRAIVGLDSGQSASLRSALSQAIIYAKRRPGTPMR
jgi:hypothetical protein